MKDDLKAYFLNPKTPKQRQYEALRAYVFEGLTAKQVAEQFEFTTKSLYALVHDFRNGKLDFFPKTTTGPKDRRITPYVRNLIIDYRKQNLSTADIQKHLAKESISVSQSSIERILKDAGFGKLKRRSAGLRGLTKKNTIIPQAAENIDLKKLKPFKAECQVAGLFLFLPYIIESGIMEAIGLLPLPESKIIGRRQAFLSFLALKLIGQTRLSHVRQYDHDQGFGLFAGLGVLPKPTYMGTYSCLVSADVCAKLQKQIVKCCHDWEPEIFSGNTINLDFHSIPHFGEGTEMEKVWCGARNKALKGANTFFAADAETNALLYANADVLRKEESGEVLRFVKYLKDLKGVVKETLVFDSRLTTYKILGQMDEDGIIFITLRRRGKKLKEQTEALPDSAWQKVKLPIPKRKRQVFLAHESDVTLKGCPNPIRQIIMKDHGRAEPTYVITNNRDMKLNEVLTIYAQRWRIENKLAELVDFFNINAMSSPIMVRIHFDLLLSVIASLLYQRLAQDLPRFEKALAPEIFRRFVDMPGTVHYDGNKFQVLIRKRAHTPVLLGVEKFQQPMKVPWLDGRKVEIVFTT